MKNFWRSRCVICPLNQFRKIKNAELVKYWKAKIFIRALFKAHAEQKIRGQKFADEVFYFDGVGDFLTN